MFPVVMECFRHRAGVWPINNARKPPRGLAQDTLHFSKMMRNMRRSGSAAPHNNWSPMVNAPK